MKSKVLELFDYRSVEIPEEIRPVPVSDEEVEAQITALSKRYGIETREQEAALGDTVCLSCQEGSLLGRQVLLYPGLGLPGAERAEEQVISRKAGESFETEIGGQPQKLTVEQILRRSAAAVDDDLVRKEQIEGVNTLEEYRQWYYKKQEAENRHRAANEIGFFMLETLTERSLYDIDDEERLSWTKENARREFEASLAEGIDSRIPEEGFELLSDEEALEQIRQRMEQRFLQLLVSSALCEQQHLMPGSDEMDRLFAALDFLDEKAEELLAEEAGCRYAEPKQV